MPLPEVPNYLVWLTKILNARGSNREPRSNNQAGPLPTHNGAGRPSRHRDSNRESLLTQSTRHFHVPTPEHPERPRAVLLSEFGPKGAWRGNPVTAQAHPAATAAARTCQGAHQTHADSHSSSGECPTDLT
jgi:hypothetical protein